MSRHGVGRVEGRCCERRGVGRPAIMVSVRVGIVDGIHRRLRIGRGRHSTVVYRVHMLEVIRVYL